MTISSFNLPGRAAALLLLSFAAACGDSSDGATATGPTVLSITPVNDATDVPLNAGISATFSEAMDPATLTATTFTLTSGTAAVPVPGTVTYAELDGGVLAGRPPREQHLVHRDDHHRGQERPRRRPGGEPLLELHHRAGSWPPGLPVNLGTAGELRDPRQERDLDRADLGRHRKHRRQPRRRHLHHRLLADRGRHERVLDLAAGDREGVRGRLRAAHPVQPDHGGRRHGARLHRRGRARARRHRAGRREHRRDDPRPGRLQVGHRPADPDGRHSHRQLRRTSGSSRSPRISP